MLALFLAGAVPIDGSDSTTYTESGSPGATTNLPTEYYYQMLETLVSDLSLQVVRQSQPDLLVLQNHPNQPNVFHPTPAMGLRHVAQSLEIQQHTGLRVPTQSHNLPDLVSSSLSSICTTTPNKKQSVSQTALRSNPSQELRVRRGYTPLRCRLDSVGSSTAESAASTPLSLMDIMMTPTPEMLSPSMNSASSSLSTNSAWHQHYAVPHVFTWTVTTPPRSPEMIPSGSPVFALDLPLQSDDMAQYQQREEAAEDWRQIGRDLRFIADNFASQEQQNGARGRNNARISSAISRNCDAKFPTICSAVFVYVAWRLLNRLVSP